MVKQTSLHLKLNSDLLVRLDKVLAVANVNRNKAINMMVESIVKCCEIQLQCSHGKCVHFFS